MHIAMQMEEMKKDVSIHNYSYAFPFERVDPKAWRYVQQHWTDSILYSTIYVVAIFGGQAVMRHRARFDLRPALAVWSGLLALFSLFGAVRTIPELVTAVGHYGLKYSVCNASYLKGISGFWAFVFAGSKLVELGDTVFIVLRKQPLIFLHWYHHVTVLIYCWLGYAVPNAPGRWFIVMNFCVHALMYTYYTMRALRCRFPRSVNMTITSLQLTQMVVGVAINVWTFQIKRRGEFCEQTFGNWCYSSLMYFTYAVLFISFFRNTYMVSKSRSSVRSSDAGNGVHLSGPHLKEV